MTDFIIKKFPYDLTSNAGLALVGQYSNRLGISAVVDRKFPVAVGGITNSDILSPTWAYWCKARTTSMPLRSSGAMPSLPATWTL